MSAPSSTSLNISGAITVEAWIKLNSIGAYQAIVSREAFQQAGTGGGYRLADPGYGQVKIRWAARYGYYAAKGRRQTGDGYKNDVEKWAKNRTFDILGDLLSDKKLVQQGNVCGYDLTNYSRERPNW